jgi:hypothetical protein
MHGGNWNGEGIGLQKLLNLVHAAIWSIWLQQNARIFKLLLEAVLSNKTFFFYK